MQRQLMWSPWREQGLEHLHIFQHEEEIVADGFILGVSEQLPFRVHYEIRCDRNWRLRAVQVNLLSGSSQSLHLLTDGEGTWTTDNGKSFPMLKGCLDVDISATPFTNTLPIRRLALQPSLSATLQMAYIQVPQLQVKVTQQCYTCLAPTSSGGRYRFESLENGVSRYTAELPVDQDGLVLDYPNLFRRVFSDYLGEA